MLPALTTGLKARLGTKLKQTFLSVSWFPSAFGCMNEQAANRQTRLIQWSSAPQHPLAPGSYVLSKPLISTFLFHFLILSRGAWRRGRGTYRPWSASRETAWVLGSKLGSSGLLTSTCTRRAISLARFLQLLINHCLIFKMFTVGKLMCYCGPVLGGMEDFWQTTLHVPTGRQAIRKGKTRVSCSSDLNSRSCFRSSWS